MENLTKESPLYCPKTEELVTEFAYGFKSNHSKRILGQDVDYAAEAIDSLFCYNWGEDDRLFQRLDCLHMVVSSTTSELAFLVDLTAKKEEIENRLKTVSIHPQFADTYGRCCRRLEELLREVSRLERRKEAFTAMEESVLVVLRGIPVDGIDQLLSDYMNERV